MGRANFVISVVSDRCVKQLFVATFTRSDVNPIQYVFFSLVHILYITVSIKRFVQLESKNICSKLKYIVKLTWKYFLLNV